MTPQEKAEALIKKMLSKSPNIQDGISIIDTIQAKLCAIIAVDELIELAKYTDGYYGWVDYYEEVKEEIEKL
jgi:hypothetical protein